MMNLATIVVTGVYANARMYATIPAGIVGATVTFEFTDPIWEGLTKTAVFQGSATRDVVLKGNTVTVPHEVVDRAGPMLKVGVYGVDAEKNLVVPTLWAAIGGIRDAADPSGDPGTAPELPIWAQLAAEVEKLKMYGGATDEQIQQAVSDYLQKNPIEKLTEEELVAAIKAYFEKNPIDVGSDVCVVYVDNNPTASNLILTSKTSDEIFDAWLNRVPIYGQYNSDGIALALRPNTFSRNKCVFFYDFPTLLAATGIITIEGDTVTDQLIIEKAYVSVTSQNINGNVVYSANATSNQIFEAYEQNALISCHFNMDGANVVLNLVACNENLAVFSNSITAVDDLPGIGVVITISGENVSYYQWEVVTKEDILTVEEIADIVNEIFSETLTDELLGAFVDQRIEAALKDHPGSGGNVDQTRIEPADNDIPKVYFTGTLPTSKAQDDVKLTMHYISKTADFIYPVTLKVQGGSSANYAKKNFTLKPYKDSTYEKKQKLAFKNWPELNKFVLKAHWIDHSHVRNVGTAKIWGKVVASRSDYDSLPEELRNSPNNGATDGFTCKVFCNGVYQGLYEWIVPKDKLFGQDDDIATHSILNSEWNNQPTCSFATTSPSMNGNWSEELHDSLSSNISTSFANLIKFVAGSTDEEFVANAENYFDVQSVIDYDILARVFCIVDNLCRNQIFFTYDGKKWYEGVWDVDAVLGLPPTTRGFFAYNTEFQNGYIAYKDYGMTNMLYQRVETLFKDRFKARYLELRAGVLSIENILDVYERLTDVITTYDGLLAEDFASTTGGGAFTGIPYKTENTIQQLRNFVAQRIPYMDEVIATMAEPIPCTGISLNTDTLTFTAEGSQTLTATVTPDGCTDEITWESNNTSVATVNGGVVTAIANGSATITAYCGEYSTSCSVTVTGMNEAIPCTGITLDKSELYFDGEGIQTITATTTPSDTTDPVVWVSDKPTVASITVAGNVCTVRSVSNGTATITATCGEHSATCTVSVINLDVNVMRGVSWYYGGVDTNTGAIDTNTNLTHSDAFDVSAYAGENIICEVTSKTIQSGIQRLVFFDEVGNYVSGANGSGPNFTATVPQNAKTARATMHSNGTGFQIMTGSLGETDFAAASETTGKYYNAANGVLTDNASYNCRKFEIEGGKSYYLIKTPSGAFFDSNDIYISGVGYHNGDMLITAPENAKYLGINNDSKVVDANVMVFSGEQIIGESTVTEILS